MVKDVDFLNLGLENEFIQLPPRWASVNICSTRNAGILEVTDFLYAVLSEVGFQGVSLGFYRFILCLLGSAYAQIGRYCHVICPLRPLRGVDYCFAVYE